MRTICYFPQRPISLKKPDTFLVPYHLSLKDRPFSLRLQSPLAEPNSVATPYFKLMIFIKSLHRYFLFTQFVFKACSVFRIQAYLGIFSSICYNNLCNLEFFKCGYYFVLYPCEREVVYSAVKMLDTCMHLFTC